MLRDAFSGAGEGRQEQNVSSTNAEVTSGSGRLLEQARTVLAYSREPTVARCYTPCKREKSVTRASS